MRILHVIAGNLFGGVETYLVSLARFGGKLEHHFALCVEGRLSEELIKTGATVHLLGNARTSRPWTVLRVRRRLAEWLEGKHFDVALTHSSWPHAIFAPTLAHAGIPTIFYLHGPITERSWLDSWAKLTAPAGMIGVSQDTVRTGRPLFPHTPAHVLPYPIPWASAPPDAAVRASVRAELGASAEEIVLLQASRADRWKGHDQLFDALGRITDVPGWTCWMAGAAQRPREIAFLNELRAQVERLGLTKRVRFLGERRDIPRLLQAADIYCQANRGPEGWSLSFMEAFAAARPVVTTRMGGAPELIDEATGVLVAPGDMVSYAAALRRLITHPDDVRTMGENARRKILSLCAPERQLAELERILTTVVAA